MSGGLTLNGLDVRTADKRIYLDLYSGMYDGLERVGDDDDVPEAAGQDWQPRRAIRRVIELRGAVAGNGATLAERREDHLAAMRELFSAIRAETSAQADDAPYPVVLTGPYLGIPTGQTWTINARYMGHSMNEPDPDWARRVIVVQLFSVDSPPDWAIVGP